MSIASDIVNGMAYLHSCQVLHRDLKPSNILLTSDLKAKVGNFGMSMINEGQKLTVETGTYRYMSPEIVRHESYGFPTDVYSFGVCLWELLTRDIPFAALTPLQAAYSVAEGQRPSIPDSIPSDIQNIFSACWDQDPSIRPTFSKLVHSLNKHKSSTTRMVLSSGREWSKEDLDSIETQSNINTATDPPVFEGAYLNNEDLCSGGNGIGLEI